jgi:hypothetical protein
MHDPSSFLPPSFLSLLVLKEEAESPLQHSKEKGF